MKISFAFVLSSLLLRFRLAINSFILLAMQLLIFQCFVFRQIFLPSQQSWDSWALLPIPFRVVGSNGLGPSTSRLSGVCSNQLSYEPIYGGGNRVRTDDPLLAGQVLYQLSYTPSFSQLLSLCEK